MTASQQAQSDAPLSVSQAMNMAQHALESVAVRLVGEVSEVNVKSGYKAAYFTVKDTAASLPCMMWNNRYRASGVELMVGQLVELTGRFTLYAAKGRMNFDVFSIALSGEGELRMKVANIAKRLQAEGLTAPERKRPIPKMPERIGLVTSPRGAAVHDVLRTLRGRFPIAEVFLAGVPVEGPNAAEGIAAGINCVVEAGAQVVLVVRGGGSFENLMPFNDEALARCIAACPVPVITGIGHEVDTTIADMVSDKRVPTPTAAAQEASPAPEAIVQFMDRWRASLGTSTNTTIDRLRARLESYAQRPFFEDPHLLFRDEGMALDYAAERLARVLPTAVARNRDELAQRNASLIREGSRLTKRFATQIAAGAARLEDLSPLGILARGYSITRDGEGQLVRHIDQAPPGASVRVDIADGTLNCTVNSTVERQEGDR